MVVALKRGFEDLIDWKMSKAWTSGILFILGLDCASELMLVKEGLLQILHKRTALQRHPLQHIGGPPFFLRFGKGVRTRMFCLIIYLPCFDPSVLFCCLVFCSLLSSTERDLAQPLSSCSNRAPLYFCVLVRLRTRKVLKLQSNRKIFVSFPASGAVVVFVSCI